MFDVIEDKLKCLESGLSEMGRWLDEPWRIDVEEVRALLVKMRRMPGPPEQAAEKFKKMCTETGWYGQFLQAVNAIDVCRFFMTNDAKNQAMIIDQLCTAVRQHEKCLIGLDAGLVLPDAFEELRAERRSEEARRTGRAAHDQDPKKIAKQKAKEFVYDCWKGWRAKPSSYKSKAEFARDMLDKCEELRSQKKIEDWCRLWEKSEPC